MNPVTVSSLAALVLFGVAACLFPLSCGSKLPPPPAQPIPPPSAAPVHYWFSQQQKDTLFAVMEINSERFHPMLINGMEYTECRATEEPLGRFHDYVLVAITDDGPCGHNDGQW